MMNNIGNIYLSLKYTQYKFLINILRNVMVRVKLYLIASVILITSALNMFSQDNFATKQATDSKGYSYKYVVNDPLKARIYELKNGLTVFLRQNRDEPRMQTYIAVKAGSTYDPKETTGLAHYLEHMMFKGSQKIASTNWEKEKPYLEEISNLFELHKAANDSLEKRMIYAKIDSVSQIASKFAVPSEYDKMVSSIGASGTNAYTSEERTVYINDIPANEFEKWLKLESERFSSLVLRLFHTELETVYEEFNMYQDEDWAKASEALNAALFQVHPYGTQTVIGKAEHLKNPSMVNIHNYWNKYYVPNNMAISISGDLDFELIDKYYGQMKRSDIQPFNSPVEQPITKPIFKEVLGPNPEFVNIGFRLGSYNDKDRYYATMIDYILNNSKAGLIDLDLVKKQKVLEAYSATSFRIYYGDHTLYGRPREGQTLEEVKDLLLGEIDKIKRGEFDEWLIKAIINEFKLGRIRQQESNGVAHSFVSVFANNSTWENYCRFVSEMEKITKADIIEFANKTYGNNYAVVYKRVGKDSTLAKVDKPAITSIDMNRENNSAFYQEFVNIKQKPLLPVFVSYKDSIKVVKLKNGIELNYIRNHNNDLFSLYFILDMGSKNNLKLPLAVNYLPYIGTNKYSPEDLSKEFYKLGISYGVFSADDRSYIYISGLEENLEKGLELLEHLITDAKPDKEIYEKYVDNILKERINDKLDKNSILWGALFNYGMYGEFSPFTNKLSESTLKSIDPKELTDMVKDIVNFKQYSFYFGKDSTKAISYIEKYHKLPPTLKEYPKPVKYNEIGYDKNVVYFVDYDMVQSNMLLITKDRLFDKSVMPEARLFGEFYGSGLSSIVFQEIRESKGLAYSAFAAYTIPQKPDESHYIYGFVGTQPDKLKTASDALIELLNHIPKADKQFELSKEGIKKRIESERITKSSIFWNYLSNKDLNIDYDSREDVYKKIGGISIDDFAKFFDDKIKGKKYAFLIIGNKKSIDFEVLKQIGEVKELTLEEVFKY